MPEGPECTTIAKQLDSKLKSSYLVDIDILSGRYLKKLPEKYDEFTSVLPIKINSIKNKGKFIYASLEKDWYIYITLGMSGSFKVHSNKYERIKFIYIKENNNTQYENCVYFSDMRNFGTLKFVQGFNHIKKKLNSLGPDMLNNPCSLDDWLKLCDKHKNKSLVNFLMTQSVISGVGNIYKSESLFLSRLFPANKIKECSTEELTNLYNSVIKVLKTAYVTGGSTISTYSDIFSRVGTYTNIDREIKDISLGSVMVYGKKEDPFGNPISKVVLDDRRTTYYSPKLQK